MAYRTPGTGTPPISPLLPEDIIIVALFPPALLLTLQQGNRERTGIKGNLRSRKASLRHPLGRGKRRFLTVLGTEHTFQEDLETFAFRKPGKR